jgi:hypothetical protein
MMSIAATILLIGTCFLGTIETCWAQRLEIEDLNIFQNIAQPFVNPVTITFRVHNTGPASFNTFGTTISGLGDVTIDTASVDN